MRPIIATLVATAATLAGLCPPAHAVVVNIDARVSGCDSQACGNTAPLPAGSLAGNPINPVQLTLPAGTYTATNGSGLPGADPSFTAWNYGQGWIWEFGISDDATHRFVLDGCCGTSFPTQAAAAAQLFAQYFSRSFTLTGTTTLDFFIQDPGLFDNAGGVAINVAAVPEPQTWALWAAGTGMLCALVRRRRPRA